MIRTEEFIAKLKSEHGYCTPDTVVRGIIDRMLGRMDFWYYRRVFGVILKGGRMARHGRWNRVSWQDLSLDIWRGVEGCGGRMEVTGCGHLASLPSPAVIVANHMSLLETFAIPAVVLPFQPMTFVVKESLLKVPLFRDVMAGVQPLCVTRQNPREDFKKLMEEGPAVLAAGRSIVVFPQSTRSVVFKPDEFNTIGIKLAKKAEVPLLPLALKTDFHGLGRRVRDLGRVDRRKTVRFAFGPPIRIEGSGREAHEAAVDFIAKTFAGWGGAVGPVG